MKEVAIPSASEINTMLNRISGMFQELESMLEKTLKTAEKAKTRLYSENWRHLTTLRPTSQKGSRQWRIPATQNPQQSGQ